MKLLRDQELRVAVAADMRAGEDDGGCGGGGSRGDGHEHDLVMPGFRFHPTEEELIEFYLRRKVEGRRFNVELIAFLDLYSYDPWELPEMARIGEKEWYFYVPRDRKYRNGDRPNRVTRSGYWKATGADRMIKGEGGQRPIGLKKTLVFYGGKAPKGVRSSWIMNEYRLPHTADRAIPSHAHHFYHIHKTEISLCRVYKRSGVEDHCQLTGTLNLKPSSSQGTAFSPTNKKHRPPPPPAALLHSSAPPKPPEKIQNSEICSNLPSLPIIYGSMTTASVANSLSSTASMEEDTSSLAQYHSKPPFPLLTSATNSISDELHRTIGYGNGENFSTMMEQPDHQHHLVLQPPREQILPPLNQYLSLPMISEKLWEWWNCNPNSTVSDAGKDFTGFK